MDFGQRKKTKKYETPSSSLLHMLYSFGTTLMQEREIRSTTTTPNNDDADKNDANNDEY